MRARTASRASLRPASIMPSIAAVTASDCIFMKSVRVLSRSKTIARITGRGRLLAREPEPASEADLAVVDADIEAAVRVVADPRLVGDRRSVAAVVGQRQQDPLAALETLGKRELHPGPLHHTTLWARSF